MNVTARQIGQTDNGQIA